MILRKSAIVVTVVGLSLSLALSACSNPTIDPTDAASTNTATPSETASASPSAVPEVFTMPTTCADIVPASRVASFADQDLVLLGGPGGRYENDYLADPTPEENAGGISCIWGFSDTEVSSITVSVAPVNPDSRGGVIDSLLAAGLNESQLENASVYGKEGDTDYNPAVINAVSADSWISVITTVGGPAAYEDAKAIVAEVTASVYSPAP